MAQNLPAQLALFDTHPAPPVVRAIRRQTGHSARLFAQNRRESGLEICVLGSGSGGNATVVRFGGRALLLDAGFGPRSIQRRLAQAGMTLTELDGVCLTHLDADHFRPAWVPVIRDLGLTLHLHRWHLDDLRRVRLGQTLLDAGRVNAFGDDGFRPFEDDAVQARVVRLQHDRQGTIGYRFDFEAGARGSLGYATDLGHAPAALIDCFAGVDILCIESNYDEHMTIHSSRPSYVNRRNMSDSGHLSNDQALDAVLAIDARSPAGCPQHVVLLHRSSQCNHPTKLRRTFERCPRIAARVTLAEQRTRTRWFSAHPRPATQRCQKSLAG